RTIALNQSYYQVLVDPALGLTALWRLNAGVFQLLGYTYAAPLTSGTNAIQVRRSGPQIVIVVGGTTALSATDAVLAGKGLGLAVSAGMGDTVGEARFTNYTVTGVGVPMTPTVSRTP